jgi:hypothetical protein
MCWVFVTAGLPAADGDGGDCLVSCGFGDGSTQQQHLWIDGANIQGKPIEMLHEMK